MLNSSLSLSPYAHILFMHNDIQIFARLLEQVLLIFPHNVNDSWGYRVYSPGWADSCLIVD